MARTRCSGACYTLHCSRSVALFFCEEVARLVEQAARAERAEAHRVADKVYWGPLLAISLQSIVVLLPRTMCGDARGAHGDAAWRASRPVVPGPHS